ncbi:hypothetical protein SMICM304S_01087 [Streptomyces microflavus]
MSQPKKDVPLRSDALRNRERILHVAMAELTVRPDVPLSTIAKKAGVGQGTFYRNFPHREALVLEIYRYEMQQVADAAAELLCARAPEAALREWMDRLALFAMTKAGLADAIRLVTSAPGGPAKPGPAPVMAAAGSTAPRQRGRHHPDRVPEDFFLASRAIHGGQRATALGLNARRRAGAARRWPGPSGSDIRSGSFTRSGTSVKGGASAAPSWARPKRRSESTRRTSACRLTSQAGAPPGSTARRGGPGPRSAGRQGDRDGSVPGDRWWSTCLREGWGAAADLSARPAPCPGAPPGRGRGSRRRRGWRRSRGGGRGRRRPRRAGPGRPVRRGGPSSSAR